MLPLQKLWRAALLSLVLGAAASSWAQASGPAPWVEVEGGAWTVPDDVRSGMAAALLAEADRHWHKGQRLPLESYIVQYQGLSKDGVRTVKLAGACALKGATPEVLKKQFYVVFDGGTCFFDATYDPAQQRFVAFSFHGRA